MADGSKLLESWVLSVLPGQITCKKDFEAPSNIPEGVKYSYSKLNRQHKFEWGTGTPEKADSTVTIRAFCKIMTWDIPDDAFLASFAKAKTPQKKSLIGSNKLASTPPVVRVNTEKLESSVLSVLPGQITCKKDFEAPSNIPEGVKYSYNKLNRQHKFEWGTGTPEKADSTVTIRAFCKIMTWDIPDDAFLASFAKAKTPQKKSIGLTQPKKRDTMEELEQYVISISPGVVICKNTLEKPKDLRSGVCWTVNETKGSEVRFDADGSASASLGTTAAAFCQLMGWDAPPPEKLKAWLAEKDAKRVGQGFRTIGDINRDIELERIKIEALEKVNAHRAIIIADLTRTNDELRNELMKKKAMGR